LNLQAFSSPKRLDGKMATMEEIPPIPETSPTRYLSGMAALNLISPNGTGDWHVVETFFRPHKRRSRSFIAGAGCETDTLDLLGDRGIFECSEALDAMGIRRPPGNAYAATHARAIAELVLSAALHGESPEFVQLDDWMPRDSDKQEVFDLLCITAPKLTDEQRKKVLIWRMKNT
jgi:hypothetical protein